MASNKRDFLGEIRLDFLDETKKLIQEIELIFAELKTDSSDITVLNNLLKKINWNKRSAHAVGFEEFADFMHEFESSFLKLIEQEATINDDVVDVFEIGIKMMKNQIQILNKNCKE